MSSDCNDQGCIVTMKSSSAEKIRLMSSMFYGRRDVFARRYERKDGRGGYAPFCSNQWVRGVCGKCAKVKGDCATCAARDFLQYRLVGIQIWKLILFQSEVNWLSK